MLMGKKSIIILGAVFSIGKNGKTTKRIFKVLRGA